MARVHLSQTARAWLVAISFAASSGLVHVAVTRPTPLLERLALIALVFVPFSVGLAELRLGAWLAFATLAALSWWLVSVGGGSLFLYVPSVAIPAMLAWFFAATLRRGREPLITIVARAARPDTPDYLLAYSRTLTVLWAALFVAMASWDLALAVLAPHEWWSVTANLLNYLVVGAFVAGEYVFRRLRFRDYAHPGFAEYVSIVARARGVVHARKAGP
jgi:uncharacterized membrane protein